MNVRDIVSWLNGIAPLESAEDFDNVGLLLGDANTEVHGVLFGMDLTEALLTEALARGVNTIVTHHPFIFHAVKRIDYTEPQGRLLCRLAESRMNVIAAHTNWDKATGGVGDSLAQALGLAEVAPLDDYIRMGTLPTPLSPVEFASHVRRALHIEPRVFTANDRPIARVAVAGGAYGEGYALAAFRGADAYVVGEIKHHELADAFARGLSIYDAGHYPTEWPGVRALYERFLADMPSQSPAAWLHTKAPYAGALLAL